MSPGHPSCLIVALCLPPASTAAEPIDPPSQCLTDHTTGKNRKDLATWIFVSRSAPLTSSRRGRAPGGLRRPPAHHGQPGEPTDGRALQRRVAGGDPAPGLDAAKAAFEHLGRIAMMALMAHPELSALVSGLERYLDAARVGRAMEFD